jgi:hypothetical protein
MGELPSYEESDLRTLIIQHAAKILKPQQEDTSRPNARRRPWSGIRR